MSQYNIIYYSNFCEQSKCLMALMNTEKLLQFFHSICTDSNSKIPLGITKTPTIIISKMPVPYVAGDCFAWLAKIKQYKIQVMYQRASAAQLQYMQTMGQNVGMANDKLLGFSDSEMAGMSDIFAFLQNDNAMPKSYVTNDMLGKDSIFTPPLEDGSYKTSDHGKYKMSESEQKLKRDKLLTDRKKQDDLFKKQTDEFIKGYK